MCSSVNMTLRNLYSIRKYLDKGTAETMVHSLITNKLDQCNSLFVGCSRSNLAKLQRLQNSAARFVLQLPSHCHISGHLNELHWLSVEKRCHYKFLVLVFKCLAGTAPAQGGVSPKVPVSMVVWWSFFTKKIAIVPWYYLGGLMSKISNPEKVPGTISVV